MTKRQENEEFVKMLKEFPKAFGRVSFRERLMLKTAFTYVIEEVSADIKANCDFALEGKDVEIMELKEQNNKLLDVINNQDVKIADLEKENAENESEARELNIRLDRLIKENVELKEQIKQIEKVSDYNADQLTKAKDLIKNIIRITWGEGWNYSLDVKVKAEQFLKE